MSSPIIVGDYVYLHLQNDRFACVDLATGEETWRTTPFGKYWSMVTNGKNILSLDEAGDLRLIAANPDKYTLLDEKHVSDNRVGLTWRLQAHKYSSAVNAGWMPTTSK